MCSRTEEIIYDHKAAQAFAQVNSKQTNVSLLRSLHPCDRMAARRALSDSTDVAPAPALAGGAAAGAASAGSVGACAPSRSRSLVERSSATACAGAGRGGSAAGGAAAPEPLTAPKRARSASTALGEYNKTVNTTRANERAYLVPEAAPPIFARGAAAGALAESDGTAAAAAAGFGAEAERVTEPPAGVTTTGSIGAPRLCRIFRAANRCR